MKKTMELWKTLCYYRSIFLLGRGHPTSLLIIIQLDCPMPRGKVEVLIKINNVHYINTL